MVAPLHGSMEDLITAVIVSVYLLSFCFKYSVKMLDNSENEA